MSLAFESPQVDVVASVRCQVGESPLWSVAEQVLWWVDIDGRLLLRFDPTRGTTASWPVGERIGSIGLHAAGGFIGALETGVFHLRPGTDGALAAQRLASVV